MRAFFTITLAGLFGFLLWIPFPVNAQADFMMQGWYWDFPKTAQGARWADTLRLKAAELGNAGITMLWLPPLSRTASGNWSNGYDPFDLYDYGEYNQGPTHFGTRYDVDQLITALNNNNIKAIADMVYNHRDGGGVEDNPGLKNYVVNFYTWEKANQGANPYPYDRMRVVLPLGGMSGNGAGDYYFKFRSRSQHSRFYNNGYLIMMHTDKVPFQNNWDFIQEQEPNGGGDCNEPHNTIILARIHQGNIDAYGCGIDEFKLTLTADDFNASGDAVYIYFRPYYSGNSDLYIHGIWSVPRNQNIVNDLYYQTWTNFNWMPSGQGQMNWSNFKPNLDRETYLAGNWDSMDFYYDYDQFQTDTRDKLFAWTRWNWSNVGIRGFRIDAVKHFPEQFVGDLLDNLYDNNMIPPMVVGEWYSTNTDELAGWVNGVYYHMNQATKEAIKPRVFDFSLREALRQACDQYGYNVRQVFDASIVDQGKLSGFNVVTFVNNHDFRDENGFASLIKNNVMLAYAYILTNNQIGLPTIFYPDYFGYPANGPSYHPPYKGPHKTWINQLINIHNQYIYGSNARTYLNKWGSGFTNSAGSTNDQLLVYQLKGGSGFKNLVVVINFSGNRVQFSQQLDGIPVGTVLTDLLGHSAYPTTTVEAWANGVPNSIWIDLPGRSYSVWRVGAWGLYNADRSWIGLNIKGNVQYFKVWDNGTGPIHEMDLGTFIGDDKLELYGFDIKTWKKSGGDVTGGKFYYRVYYSGTKNPPSFNEINLGFMEDLGGGNQKWGFSGFMHNLREIFPGKFTMEFYIKMDGTDPNKSEYDSNNGINYRFYFRNNFVESVADGNWNNPDVWIDRVVPDLPVVHAKVNHQLVLNNTLTVKTITIAPNGKLTMTPGSHITAQEFYNLAGVNGLLLQSDQTGTATIIEISDNHATVQRYIPQANWNQPGHGWHLLASPIKWNYPISNEWTPQGTGNDYDFYAWSEPQQLWLNQKDPSNNLTYFENGKGYLVAYQQTDTKIFAGNIQFLDVTLYLTNNNNGSYSGWNLVGNPFPAHLQWNHPSWTKDPLVGGVAKVWTQGAYKDVDEDDPIIPTANGFFVYVNTVPLQAVQFVIPRNARVAQPVNWYKSEGNRIVLIARGSGSELEQRTVIKANPLATEGFDLQYDARFLTGFAPIFCSMAGNELLSTNVLPEIDQQTIIPLRFNKNQQQGELFEIEMAETITGLEVYLTDLKLNYRHKLSDVPVYQFTAQPGDNPNRFLLSFGTTGLESPPPVQLLKVWYFEGQLGVVVPHERAQLTITDMQGRTVYSGLILQGIQTMSVNLSPGVYVVTLRSTDGISSAKLLIY